MHRALTRRAFALLAQRVIDRVEQFRSTIVGTAVGKKILGLHVPQTAADPAAGRSGSADDDDFVHITPALPGLTPVRG